ncbi:MAG: hypothetical protein ACR2F2_12580 [Pyrinomonadaceae bacterium]
MAQEEDNKGTDTMSHGTGIAKGEEQIDNQGKEEGRHDTGTDEQGRPTGTSTARDSTSIDPETKGPIDEDMPNMPPA